MDPSAYCLSAAFGTRIYLAKDKIENISKARAFHLRLRILDLLVKLLISYWLFRKLLKYMNVELF